MTPREEALLRRQLDVALTDIEWLKRRLSAGGPAVGTDQQLGLIDIDWDNEGGAGLVPYIITDVGELNENLAIHRDSVDQITQGKRAIRTLIASVPYWKVDPDAAEVNLSTSTMHGVACTGQVVYVGIVGTTGDEDEQLKREIIAGMSAHNFHTAETTEDIAAGDVGEVSLTYTVLEVTEGEGEDPDTVDTVQKTALVQAKNTLDRGLVTGQTLDEVTFDDAMQTFKIISASC